MVFFSDTKPVSGIWVAEMHSVTLESLCVLTSRNESRGVDGRQTHMDTLLLRTRAV